MNTVPGSTPTASRPASRAPFVLAGAAVLALLLCGGSAIARNLQAASGSSVRAQLVGGWSLVSRATHLAQPSPR